MKPVEKDSYRLIVSQSRTGIATCAPHRNELPCALCEAAHDLERAGSSALYAQKRAAERARELAEAVPLRGSAVKTIESYNEETEKCNVVSIEDYCVMYPTAIVIGNRVYAYGDPDGGADEVQSWSTSEDGWKEWHKAT